MFFACLLSLFSFHAAATVSLSTSQGVVLIEKYKEQGQWVVDEFLVRPGRLQERQAHRVFDYEFLALDHIEALKRAGKIIQKPANVTVREKNAIPIWIVKNAWSADWETKYSEWVTDNFDSEFFVRYNLATDCADVAYTLRWIFSRINYLPAAGTLAGSNVVVTQDDGAAAWANLPTHVEWSQDTRFRTALKWLLNNVYTRTLWEDTYPLNISRETIRPGVINLLGGHTLLMDQLIDNGRDVPITFLSSTVPQAVRSLQLNIFLDSNSIPETDGGLVQFRWPVKTSQGWKLTPKEHMPFYSREQYSWKDWCQEKSFALCVYQKLNLSFQPKKTVEGIILSLNESLRLREQVVNDGIAACSGTDCSPGSIGYEDWSTPSRDKRLYESYVASETLASSLGQLDEEAAERWFNWNDQLTSLMNQSRKGWFSLLSQGLISYDPRDSLGSRWGSSLNAIEDTVKRKWEVFEEIRSDKLKEAVVCREDPALCSIGSSEYQRLSTHELDLELKKTVRNYGLHCLQRTCPPNLFSRMDTLWFMRPQPWLSLDERTGNTAARHKSKVFYGVLKMLETQSGLVVIDGTRLYDPASDTTTFNPGVNYHVTPNGQLLRQDQAGTWLEHSGNFVLIDKVSATSRGYMTQLLDTDTILVSESSEKMITHRIVQISSGGRIWSGQGSAEFYFGLPYIIMRDSESKIVDIKSGEETSFPLLSGNLWGSRVMAKLGPHHYVFQAMDYVEGVGSLIKTFEVTGGSFNLISSDRGYAQTFIVNNSQMTVRSRKVYFWKYDEAEPIHYEDILTWFTLSPKQFYFETNRGSKVVSENDEGFEEFLNMPSDEFYVLGHSQGKLSFFDSKGFHLIDQRGTEVSPTQRLRGMGDCNSGATRLHCSSAFEIKFSALGTQNLFDLEGLVDGVPFYTKGQNSYDDVGIAIKGSIIRPYDSVLIFRTH